MKIGQKFTRSGVRYEFLGFQGKKWRVRERDSGRKLLILSPSDLKAREKKEKELERERLKIIEAKAREEQRIRNEAMALMDNVALRKLRDDQRILYEVNALTENVDALRRLRDDHQKE